MDVVRIEKKEKRLNKEIEYKKRKEGMKFLIVNYLFFENLFFCLKF